MDERHYLVGTAGHVDHGKTELIRALSGIETDRLKEEKQRGISIELGFAHMLLPSGRQVGMIDVPGHERFVRQMLSGASGMDIVLLVIAADEGVMPQTQEHLDILTLLGIPRGIIVLNKVDLVDEDWLELMEEEVREKLNDTVFSDARICRVSAVTGEGIDILRQTIDDLLSHVESKKSTGPVRMPIDRVFSIQGFGTVVTGTLHGGTIELGQELAIEPSHLIAKVRSLQVYNSKVNIAGAGQRVAVNLAGIEVAEVERGSVLVTPNMFKVGKVLDLKVTNLPSAEKPLIQRQRVRFHLGTTEILGRIHLLDHQELIPGQEGFAQILLEDSVLAAPGDRFVLRFYSPTFTIAGGKVLSVAEFKAKRFKQSVLDQMIVKDQGDPLDLLEREMDEPRTSSDLKTRLHINSVELEEFIKTLKESNRLEIWIEDDVSLYWGKDAAELWRQKLITVVKSHEEEYPLRGGISREELKTRLGITWTHHRWQTILEQGCSRKYYRISGSKVQTNEGVQLPPVIARRLNALRTFWQNVKLMPPDLGTVSEACEIPKTEIQEYAGHLCELGEWVSVNGLFYRTSDIQQAKITLLEALRLKGEIGVAEARELWETSRKYAVPLLEFFDQQKITQRKGDKRVLHSSIN
ncbi:selenocysteine-specific translation elongation factor [Desulfosporosinus sp.]|uniref:selenocysteine-specific translation elongation factor n=1 Tax=Desulfosporosinus sp. TaxID=157907 RepID=UPI0025BE9366|nr:selenocysteine-specific translation elongation factor [Desulfosporosinus sp.]MBC2724160.1 selenocysteine-specific translation elongation factor [Desulfosporosinus sp.]MBC2727904.1 selenocysteine-specific translation elongation factor [Desulfosporosinus sp.]